VADHHRRQERLEQQPIKSRHDCFLHLAGIAASNAKYRNVGTVFLLDALAWRALYNLISEDEPSRQARKLYMA
jgi:hypothetical protein